MLLLLASLMPVASGPRKTNSILYGPLSVFFFNAWCHNGGDDDDNNNARYDTGCNNNAWCCNGDNNNM